MLHDRQQLDVREAQVGDVVDEVLGELAVRQALSPRPEVHLVDAHRPVVGVAAGPSLHPGPVAPGVVGVVDDRPRVGRHLGAAGHRVGLGAHDVVGAADLELVDVPDAHVGHEQLPDARGPDEAHRVDPAVPVVEVPDDAHGLGARRPHRERDAADGAHRAVVLPRARAQDRPELLVASLVDEVQVDLTEGRREAVGVVLEVVDAVGPGDEQPVVHRARDVGAHRRPHALRLVRQLELLAVLEAHPHGLRQRLEHPDAQAPRLEVLAEEVVGLLVAPLDERGDRAADLGAGEGVTTGLLAWGSGPGAGRAAGPAAGAGRRGR